MQKMHGRYFLAVPKLIKILGRTNALAVPHIQRVVVNAGVGKMLKHASSGQEDKILADTTRDLARICAQKPILRRARTSIAGFKIRAGDPVGVMATLRGKHMYDFLDRLIHVALPRTRDFRGIPRTAVDAGGNMTLGVREHTVFPEIPTDEVRHPFGFSVTIVTSARSRDEALLLFEELGFPLKSAK